MARLKRMLHSSILFHLILFVTSFLDTPEYSVAGNTETDRQALLEIKAKIIDNPLGGATSSWNDSLDFCTIPHEIGRLHKLEYLWLSDNSFSGDITPNISSCSNLIELVLGNNVLEGRIPSSLGNLTSLEILFLGPYNSLVGEIPDSLGRLKKLVHISLAVNYLSGVVPPSIFNLSLLTSIDFGMNSLEGSLPSYLGNTLPYLQNFSIDSNMFSGNIPNSFSNLSNLERLQLDSNNFIGQVPSLNKLEKLNWIELGNNSLGTGQAGDLNFISSLFNTTNLEVFHISGNNFGGTLPKIICNFSMLKTVAIASNKIGGEIPTCITNLAYLQNIWAWGNKLTGVIPSSIGQLKNLNKINVLGNQLSGYIPTSVGNLTELTILDFSQNNLNGSIPSSLGNCKKLLHLGLSHNNLIGRIPSLLLSLSTSLIEINLSSNHLSEALPAEIGQLKNLGMLDVSRNMLSGAIPNTIAACVELEYLYVGGNLFQGAIPYTLKTLKGLLELDMSQNNLSGQIPDFLQNMKLQMLNLSNNNLEGYVPTHGIFSSATAFSVFGNMELCGGIPELELPPCNLSKTSRKSRWAHRRRFVTAISIGLSGFFLLMTVASLYAYGYMKKQKEPPASSDSENGLLNLSYQSLYKATDGFSFENSIGSGTFGVVYKGTLEHDRSIVAIKTFNLQHKAAAKTFMAECGVLRNIKHRNLVKVITACSGVDYQGNDFKALVYEYMVNGSLDEWLHPELRSISEGTSDALKSLNLLRRLNIAVDVALALEYLHHHCGATIVHCDLKPSNVLLDDEMVAHVGDFGLAKFLSEGITNCHENQSSSIGVRGTIGYTPPEYGLGNEVSTYGDVYSFGILLLEMFTGKRPTDHILRNDLSLHGLVKAAIPEQVTEILDDGLLAEATGEDISTSGAHNLSRDGNSEIMKETLISVLEIALSCSTELPQERPDMRDVAPKLSSIRDKFVRALSQRQKRRN